MEAHNAQLKSLRRTQIPAMPVPSHYGQAADEQGGLLTVVFGAIRRRWWAFLIAALASGGAAYAVAMNFGRDSAVSSAVLIHTGLPGTTGPGGVYQPLSQATCAEILTSTAVLDEVIKRRNLQTSAASFALRLQVKAPQHSNLIEVHLTWTSPEETIAVLNDLADVFIEQIVTQRKSVLNNYIRHSESTLLDARAEVDTVRQELRGIELERERQLSEGGLTSDKYRSALSSVTSTELLLSEKQAEMLGLQQQMAAVDMRLKEALEQLAAEIMAAKDRTITETRSWLEARRAGFAAGSSAYNEFSRLFPLLEAASMETVDLGTLDRLSTWQSDLRRKLEAQALRSNQADLTELAKVHDAVFASVNTGVGERVAQLESLQRRREQFELSLIPAQSQIQMLETRLADYKRQVEDVSGIVAGSATSNLEEAQSKLEAAQRRESMLSQQLESLRNLEKCRVREWTLSTPASVDTTLIDSDRLKLFVLTFGLCGMLLASPPVLLEWLDRREAPQMRTARSLGVPIVSNGVLSEFLPARRRRLPFPLSPSEEQIESLRLIALRIQQTVHDSSSVAVFSSLDSHRASAPLIAAVAKCLADRGERVLVIDAVSPERGSFPIRDLLLPASEREKEQHEADSKNENRSLILVRGLSDYLTRICRKASEVIRATEIENVDLITSGNAPFPREAMASHELTVLLEECRREYSIILVCGPPARWSADLEMLAARADGIVLTASSRGGTLDPRAAAAFRDLLDLQAPIIGVVG